LYKRQRIELAFGEKMHDTKSKIYRNLFKEIGKTDEDNPPGR
jgi:hypothetical protein